MLGGRHTVWAKRSLLNFNKINVLKKLVLLMRTLIFSLLKKTKFKNNNQIPSYTQNYTKKLPESLEKLYMQLFHQSKIFETQSRNFILTF